MKPWKKALMMVRWCILLMMAMSFACRTSRNVTGFQHGVSETKQGVSLLAEFSLFEVDWQKIGGGILGDSPLDYTHVEDLWKKGDAALIAAPFLRLLRGTEALARSGADVYVPVTLPLPDLTVVGQPPPVHEVRESGLTFSLGFDRVLADTTIEARFTMSFTVPDAMAVASNRDVVTDGDLTTSVAENTFTAVLNVPQDRRILIVGGLPSPHDREKGLWLFGRFSVDGESIGGGVPAEKER